MENINQLWKNQLGFVKDTDCLLFSFSFPLESEDRSFRGQEARSNVASLDTSSEQKPIYAAVFQSFDAEFAKDPFLHKCWLFVSCGGPTKPPCTLIYCCCFYMCVLSVSRVSNCFLGNRLSLFPGTRRRQVCRFIQNLS